MRVATLAVLLTCSAAFGQVPDGPEFRVNSFTPDSQYGPAIAVHETGAFVVVWTSWDQFGSGGAIMGQRYDARGLPIGVEFRVSTAAQGIGTQHHPAVAFDRSGGFMTVWSAFAPSSGAIFGQRFDAAGARVGGELRFTPPTAADQFSPRIAPARDGGFVVVWTCSDLVSHEVCARRLSPDGTAAGVEFLVNTTTTGFQGAPDVARESDGGFVVVWQSDAIAGSYGDVAAQRYDAELVPRGSEFRVNAATTGNQWRPLVAADRRGGFTVVWEAYPATGIGWDIAARRFSAGAPVGAELMVNSFTTANQQTPAIASDDAGNFVVTWADDFYDIHGRRFSAAGAPRGAEFVANTYTPSRQLRPAAASDSAGNLILTWDSWPQDAGTMGVYARRYGGPRPHALEIAGGVNGIVEVPSAFNARTAWRNDGSATVSFQGTVAAGAPPGLVLAVDPDVDYAAVPAGTAAFCAAPCYAGVLSGQRSLGHVDLRLDETIVPDVQGQTKRWLVHVGGSFPDVPGSSPFYRFVETILHRGVTAGCSPAEYCPAGATTREQMATFILVAREGQGYVPPACTTATFADVPAGSPYCRWIEELARRGVVAGCGGGNYCPAAPVTREQMAVFVLAAREPGVAPPACGAPMFDDVPASSPFCRWIEELARRGVVAGCGGGAYCPTLDVARDQMSVFLTVTFGLALYGP